MYSCFARYSAKSGNLTYGSVAEDLFANKLVKPDIEFLPQLTLDALQRLIAVKPIKKVIEKHTLFSYYSRFLGKERREKAFQSLLEGKQDYRNYLRIPKSKERNIRYLRFCPVCVEEDRRLYQETYWHRAHQLIGIDVCPLHGCYLCSSMVEINSKGSPSLVTAEECVSENASIKYCENELEVRLAKYTTEVMNAKLDIECEIPIGSFLHSKLEGSKYLSQRGEQRNMELLYHDFKEFYKKLPEEKLMEQWQIQKVFSSQRLRTDEVCMIAMFLNIPVDELTHMTMPNVQQKDEFDEQIKSLHKKGMNYRQIAIELNASYDLVKSIGEGRYGKRIYQTSNPQKGGVKKYDWKRIDAETLPLVQKKITKIRADNINRPTRITQGLIERSLNLPKKRLTNCPLCLAEIKNQHETQEEHWARVVKWAVDRLLQEGKEINISNIIHKSNINKRNVYDCISCSNLIADEKMSKKIKELIGGMER